MSAHHAPAAGDRTSGVLIGRARETAEVRRLLPRTRLLTLTGAGGVGKTRLAQWAARSLRGRFPGGVKSVDLATLEDGALIEPALATVLGVRDTGRRAMSVLVDHMADRRMLLVLDNCEHLLRECADLVTGLLRDAPRLRILATSRQALGVKGEQVLVVPVLPVPQADAAFGDIARSEAVRLFAERAAEARPGFAVDGANAQAVARLCRRLDGLPLAIELAAGRLRTTPLEDLARELDERFDVPAGRGVATPPRHRTLRATMDWSFGLCSPAERLLWARLSMFPGGVDLETAEEVCSGDGVASGDVLDLITGLVDKSVLSGERTGDGVRYRMLDSIRAYGRERLAPADERALCRRYRDRYRRLAERNRIDRLSCDQLGRYRAVQAEIPNLRLALDLCFGSRDDAPAGLEMAFALWGHWFLAGALGEGRRWLGRGLELVPQAGATRAMALWGDALFAAYQDDLPAAELLADECRALAERIGDETASAFALQACGIVALAAGDDRRGFALMQQARDRHQAAGDVDAVAVNLYFSASFSVARSPERAAALGEELLALCREHRAPLFQAYALIALGYSAWRRGDPRGTEARMREAATIMRVISDRWGLAQCLETLAWAAGADGRHERAARLLGAADRLWRVLDVRPVALRHLAHAHRDCEARARRALGSRAFTAALRAGADLGLDDAAAYAIEDGGG